MPPAIASNAALNDVEMPAAKKAKKIKARKQRHPAAIPDQAEVAPELAFARILAANEARTRTRALKKLTAWLIAQQEGGKVLTKASLLKLWKGLFYCMWMCDKRPVQEELSRNLTAIATQLSLDNGMVYLETLFATMLREWHGIDRLRMDKYYHLLTEAYYTLLVLAKRDNYSEDIVARIVDMLLAGPLTLERNTKHPIGVVLHLCDCHHRVIRRLHETETMPTHVYHALLEPFFTMMQYHPRPAVITRINESILEDLPNLSTPEHDYAQVDADQVSLRLFMLAASPDTLSKHRQNLYKYRRAFVDMHRELGIILSEPQIQIEAGNDNDDNNDGTDVTGSKQSSEAIGSRQSNNSAPDTNYQVKAPTSKNEKRKSKHDNGGQMQQHTASTESMDTSSDRQPPANADKSTKPGKKAKRRQSTALQKSNRPTSTSAGKQDDSRQAAHDEAGTPGGSSHSTPNKQPSPAVTRASAVKKAAKMQRSNADKSAVKGTPNAGQKHKNQTPKSIAIEKTNAKTAHVIRNPGSQTSTPRQVKSALSTPRLKGLLRSRGTPASNSRVKFGRKSTLPFDHRRAPRMVGIGAQKRDPIRKHNVITPDLNASF